MEFLIYMLVTLFVVFVPYYVGRFILKINKPGELLECYWFGLLITCAALMLLAGIIVASQSIINAI
jgi:hypothetical protein